MGVGVGVGVGEGVGVGVGDGEGVGFGEGVGVKTRLKTIPPLSLFTIQIVPKTADMKIPSKKYFQNLFIFKREL